MPGSDRVGVSREALEDLCQRHRIRRLSLFGSALREDFSETSDVDVLVEFEPGTRVTFFSLSRVEDDLSGLFGRRADVHIARSLSPHLRDRVLAQARDLYVAA
jgi:predicted nucleotidyltransferase